MRLKNKKTGEIVEVESLYLTQTQGLCLNYMNKENKQKVYTTDKIASFNLDWEDYEEPKEYWYIDYDGEILCGELDNSSTEKMMISMGNHFESIEEAKKAVEKLRAWKRLKDRGFRFKGISGYDEIHFWFPKPDDMFENSDTRKDLDLLFFREDD